MDPYSTNTEYIDCIASLENLEENLLKSEETSEMRTAISKLPPQEMELVMMVYYKGVSLNEYASKKGVTYYQAAKEKNSVLCKLGNHFKQ